MIVDAAVNLPGSFHDSGSAMWCNIYSHITKLPGDYKIVPDDAFCCSGELKGKIVKTKLKFCYMIPKALLH